MTTAPDYRRVAEQAVSLLCSVGCYGLDPSRQRALDLDRQIHPSFPPVTVWTEEEGDVDPPRRPNADAAPATESTETGK
jgi:hypothetical protein